MQACLTVLLPALPDRAASSQRRLRRRWRGSLLPASLVASREMTSTIVKSALSWTTTSRSGFSWFRATAKCVALPRTRSYSEGVSVIARLHRGSPHSQRKEPPPPSVDTGAKHARAVDSFCSRQRACLADSRDCQLFTAIDRRRGGQRGVDLEEALDAGDLEDPQQAGVADDERQRPVRALKALARGE